jgi:hypothetical protein
VDAVRPSTYLLYVQALLLIGVAIALLTGYWIVTLVYAGWTAENLMMWRLLRRWGQ